MQELLAQSSFDKLKEGTIVSGVITEIRANEVVVDIGGKAEGVIPANEFSDLGELQIGSTIEVILEKLEDKEGNPILSYEQAQQMLNRGVDLLRAAGVQNQGDVDCYLAMVAGLVDAQISNEPGGNRWTRHLDRLTDMHLDQAARNRKRR